VSSPITTHALDTARGAPAAGLPVELEQLTDDGWRSLVRAVTNDDGRVPGFTDGLQLQVATYRMTFDTDAYFTATSTEGFYPVVRVVFQIRAPDEHYHVPLLISPFGYSTYRGS
jgi:5-hydroxyisourate hydrolase